MTPAPAPNTLPFEYHAGAGGVFIDGSYDLLVNNSRWGNLNNPHVTIDPESARNVPFIKMAYMRLAQAFVNRGEYEKAITVMDKCQEFFPDERIPFAFYYEGYFPELYYRSGAMEKGDAVLRKIVANASDNLRYYLSLEPRFIEYYKEDWRDDLALINTMTDAAKRNNRYDIQQELESTVDDFLNHFLPYLY